MVRIIGPLPGGGQPAYVESTSPTNAALGAGTLTGNAVYLFKARVFVATVVTQMTYYVGTASGNVDLGIYDSADGGTTLSKQASTGSTAASGTNAIQTINLTASLTLQPGKDYWLAFGVDNGTLTAAKYTSIGAINARSNRCVSKAGSWSSGLPNSISGHAGNSQVIWVEAA